MHHTATILLHVSMLVASGSFDARATNTLYSRCQQTGTHFEEWNPALRPFAGHAGMYLAIPAGDLAIYGALRLWHKPGAARDFAFGETTAHFGLGINALRQALPVWATPPANACPPACAQPAQGVTK
jgi:hypothetical protein